MARTRAPKRRPTRKPATPGARAKPASTPAKPGVPVNWTQLRTAERERIPWYERDIAMVHEVISELLEDIHERGVIRRLEACIGDSSHGLAPFLVIAGADVARKRSARPAGALEEVLSRGDEVVIHNAPSAVRTVSYLGLLRILGVALPASAEGVEARWLGRIARRTSSVNDYLLRTAALAAAAIGEVELVPAFLGGGPLVSRTYAREIAGADVPGFTRHVAEVIRGKGTFAAVEDVWVELLRMFPLTYAADGVEWMDLVWAAQTIAVQIQHRPVTDVATWLPELVARLP